MSAMGMQNDQLIVKWTGASGPVAVRIAMIGLKLAAIKPPVIPKKKHAVVNHMMPNGMAVQGMMPPTVAVSRRSVICMLALNATASKTEPTIDRVSVRHRLGNGIGGISSKMPPRARARGSAISLTWLSCSEGSPRPHSNERPETPPGGRHSHPAEASAYLLFGSTR